MEREYQRAENHIFYPHENLVKFVNRHVRKRLGIRKFRDHIRPAHGETLTALDFGCGIGAGVIMLHEFGIRACGVDISSVSIDIARQYARSKGLSLDDCFSVIQPNERLPFDDGQFDFFTACGVLDSMPFAAARQNMQELSRVTTQCAYISLVAGDYIGCLGEQEVRTAHEQDTIQSYFDYDKCLAHAGRHGLCDPVLRAGDHRDARHGRAEDRPVSPCLGEDLRGIASARPVGDNGYPLAGD